MPVFPKIFRVRQSFEGPRLEDVAGAVEAELPASALAADRSGRGRASPSRPEAAGSPTSRRSCGGRANISQLGAEPFLVPAMGSHGGGTAEGQRQVLESYGITEAAVGCPIRSSMETTSSAARPRVSLAHRPPWPRGRSRTRLRPRQTPYALAGDFQSGLLKMLLIGLGKQAGANIYHRAIEDYSFDQIVRSVAREVSQVPFVAGLAIVENAYDETALIEAVEPAVRAREMHCWPWPASGCPGCRSTRPTCC